MKKKKNANKNITVRVPLVILDKHHDYLIQHQFLIPSGTGSMYYAIPRSLMMWVSNQLVLAAYTRSSYLSL